MPVNSSDKSINLHIKDNNNSGTFGVLLYDIVLHPQTDMTINSVDNAVLNSTYGYSVSNAPSSGITYTWNMAPMPAPPPQLRQHLLQIGQAPVIKQ